MNGWIQGKLGQIARVCARRHVRRLCLFGSATGEGFEPGRSDLDFLVEFEPLAPAQHADAYFGLADDLEELLAARIDLVELAAIRNPYFLRAIEQSRAVLYDVA